MPHARPLALAASALGSLALAASVFAQSTAAVSIDVAVNRHPINPFVYGTSYGTVAQLQELRTPLVRMGGNNTSRYNWQINADNRARDWYFESIAAESGSAVPGEVGDTFIQNAKAAGAEPVLTVPIIGWIAKLGANRAKLASYSVAKYGRQTAVDRWFRDAGNGVLRRGGALITWNDPNDADVPNGVALQSDWASHLVSRWNGAANGGLRYYTLDNEHSIWQETHRDVQPTGATGSELLNGPLGPANHEVPSGLIDYAKALKAVDPGAQLVGPEEWGWSGFELSGYDQQYGKTYGWTRPLPDEATHCVTSWDYGRDQNGNEDCWYVPWMLRQLKAAETGGQPLLDVLSVHWYPQGGEYGDDTTSATQLLRNRSTRVLWDPNYHDPTWIDANVALIPRLRRWANDYNAGTKIALTEYNWGAEKHINGATTQADIFGIFGREGLDMGARWVMPDSATPTYKAMKMYRNYDGNGGAFGDTSVGAVVANDGWDSLSAFAAQRGDGTLTVVVVNKVLSGSTTVTLSLASFTPGPSASLWQLTSANVINRLPDVAAGGPNLTLTVPAQSITMVVIPRAAQ